MGRLPPDPLDVIAVEWSFDAYGVVCTSTTRYSLPGVSSYGLDELELVLDQIAFGFEDLWGDLGTDGISLTAYSATVASSPGLALFKPIEAVRGIWPGHPTLNTATDIYWRTLDAGKRGHGITYLPGFARDFTDDGRHLNSSGFINIAREARQYLEWIAGVETPTLAPLRHVTVERVRGGVPLDVAEASVAVDGVPSRRVGTLRRRLGFSGRVSPR